MWVPRSHHKSANQNFSLGNTVSLGIVGGQVPAVSYQGSLLGFTFPQETEHKSQIVFALGPVPFVDLIQE